MKKSFLFTLLAVALAVSCTSTKENQYTTNTVCTFDYTDAIEMVGDDQVYFDNYFMGGGVMAFLNKAAGDVFLGGCALVGLEDDTLEEGHIAAPLSVFGKGYNGSKYYLTIKYDPNSANMPEHLATFVQKDSGTMHAAECQVNNTNRLVHIATFGLPAHDDEDEIPAFQDGDYLKLRIYSTSGSATTSEKFVEVTLAERKSGILSVINEWKTVDLTPLGGIEAIDVALLSNRSDIPLCFCIDNLAIAATILL
ncbi:MAG: DUF4465 domain-containing protein [Bacteroidales bacterium]|nr:DUF4465 domain-containing protein [Bacteroidales bacterium]